MAPIRFLGFQENKTPPGASALPAPRERDTKGERRTHIQCKIQGDIELPATVWTLERQVRGGARGPPGLSPDCGPLELLHYSGCKGCRSVAG